MFIIFGSTFQMSKLSVDAAVFVPSHSRNNSAEFTTLPQYVTSCYPFVQGDPGVAG